MKTNIATLLVGLVLGAALGNFAASSMPERRPYAPPLQVFDVQAEMRVREFAPGGAFVEGRTVYETCETGRRIRHWANGLMQRTQTECWK